jgi:hypothetical protein
MDSKIQEAIRAAITANDPEMAWSVLLQMRRSGYITDVSRVRHFEYKMPDRGRIKFEFHLDFDKIYFYDNYRSRPSRRIEVKHGEQVNWDTVGFMNHSPNIVLGWETLYKAAIKEPDYAKIKAGAAYRDAISILFQYETALENLPKHGGLKFLSYLKKHA